VLLFVGDGGDPVGAFVTSTGAAAVIVGATVVGATVGGTALTQRLSIHSSGLQHVLIPASPEEERHNPP